MAVFPPPNVFFPYLPDTGFLPPPMPIPVPVGKISDFGRYVGPTVLVPLQVRRGDSIEWVFRLYREVHGAPPTVLGGVCGTQEDCCDPDAPYGRGVSPQVLTGLQGRATVRKAKEGKQGKQGAEQWDLTVTVDQTGAGSPTRGTVIVQADATLTRTFPEFGVWDLELSDGTDSLRKTIVEGPLWVNRDVSY